MSLRTDFKDEIPAGGSRKYGLVDNSGNYLYKDVKIVRTNENVQDGDEFGAAEVNTIHEYLNLMHNDNLLVNGDFQINQRGKNEYSANGTEYTVDMWRIHNNHTLTVFDGYIKIETRDGHNVYFTQVISLPKNKYKICVKVKSFVGSPTIKFENGGVGVGETTITKVGVTSITFDTIITGITVTVPTGSIIEIEYIDLFEGSIAYPHIKEDFAIALMRCMRFVQSINYSITHNSISNSFANYSTVFLPIPMANEPTVVYQQQGESINISTIKEVYSRGNINVQIVAKESGMVRVIGRTILLSCEPI